MEFHEKSLELNITHELLNLADSWSWFLSDIELWEYWTPGFRFPLLRFPRSTSGGFHITTEGKDDPTGTAGGGFDVRIKAGGSHHLLFIQYKKGEKSSVSPDPKSEFNNPPHDHFVFEFNNTSTNQHFVLRNLANGVGGNIGNAVVYAFPLIGSMEDMEANAGRLVRKTKFISIRDLDNQAALNKVTIARGQQHNFRVDLLDMKRCEVNYYYYYYYGPDRAKDVIADIIAVKFQKALSQAIYDYKRSFGVNARYRFDYPYRLQRVFRYYVNYLLQYFEVSRSRLDFDFIGGLVDDRDGVNSRSFENNERDIEIVTAIFLALKPFAEFIDSFTGNENQVVPTYIPKFLFSSDQSEIVINFESEFRKADIENIGYLRI